MGPIVDKFDRHATKTSCSAFCSKLKAGVFSKEALIFWMQQITDELTKETEEEKKPGEEHDNAASIPLADRKG